MNSDPQEATQLYDGQRNSKFRMGQSNVQIPLENGLILDANQHAATQSGLIFITVGTPGGANGSAEL
jgi:hypothetical protein